MLNSESMMSWLSYLQDHVVHMLNFESMMSWLLYLQEHIVHTLNFELMMSCLAITFTQTKLAVAQEKFVKESMKPDGGE